MSQKWNVMADGVEYEIEYINNKKIRVNGNELALKDYQTKLTMTTTEHELTLGSKKALLIVKSLNSAQLIMDGVDCASGKEEVPGPNRLPKWAYIFVILHCVNFLNGLSGCAMAILGIGSVQLISSSKKLSVKQEVLVDLVILIILYALTFGNIF